MERTIFIASEDPSLASGLRENLVHWDYKPVSTGSGDALFRRMGACSPMLIVLDVSDVHKGAETLAHLSQTWRSTPVIAVSRDLTIGMAVELTKIGAVDVMTNPFDLRQLRMRIDGIAKDQAAETLRRQASPGSRVRGEQPYEILGSSPAILDVLDLVNDVAETDATVLILGESGTGKELLARAIHHHSRRAEQTFVPVNVAALPPNIAESILFGHEKGAYTGADSGSQGWCATADGGTLMLDEIGEMDILLQAKLLRFLQDGTYMRVGANKQQFADVRVIAATNREPEQMVAENRLREDLYYRLNVFPIRMPPLRERKQDIPILAEAFLDRSAELHRRQVVGFTDGALECLMDYEWPGNIRQLENLVTRMVLLARDPCIGVTHIPSEIRAVSHPSAEDSAIGLSKMENVERDAIVAALRQAEGNAVAAAKILGVGQATIYRKIKRFQIELKQLKSDTRSA